MGFFKNICPENTDIIKYFDSILIPNSCVIYIGKTDELGNKTITVKCVDQDIPLSTNCGTDYGVKLSYSSASSWINTISTEINLISLFHLIKTVEERIYKNIDIKLKDIKNIFIHTSVNSISLEVHFNPALYIPCMTYTSNYLKENGILQ